MALVLNDRVKETSTTTGTGTFDLDGAVTGFETFVAGIATTNTTYYCIAHQTADEWEVGLGTVTDAATDTLSRDTVISSSNSDSKVVFTAGTSDVFCTFPASKTMEMLMTAQGDVIYASGANTPARLAPGTSGDVLTTAGAGANPAWATPTAGDITNVGVTSPITGGGSSGSVTIAIQDSSTSQKGAASFSSDNFAASSGAITIKDAGVANAELDDMAANTIKVRNANSSGVPSDLALATTEILIGDGTGFTAASLSSDVTMTNAGAVTIAANAVTLAKLEDGTQGDILYYAASGAPTRLSAGTANDVLTTAGAGANPSWVTPSGGIDWQSVVTASTLTAVAGRGYPINTTSNACTITLPAGSVGDTIELVDYAATWDTNNVTLTTTEKIQGSDSDAILSTEREGVSLVYVDATQGWLVVTSNDAALTHPQWMIATGGTITEDGDYKVHTFTANGTFEVTQLGSGGGSTSIDYLIVAGGGGGGFGDISGAGGGGGMRYNYPNPVTGGTPVSVTTYPIVVGAGGAAASPSPTQGVIGVSSSGFSVTSTGGGGGGGGGLGGVAGDGGTGGGSAYNVTSGRASGNTPPVSPSQGADGGLGANIGPSYGAGGGGGGGDSGVTGGDATAPNGGPGGNGTAITIPGASTSYGGGGGGGNESATTPTVSPGGAGGGGPGSQNGTAGTVNTGGGGGGSNDSGSAAGGSGVVVVRYKFQ